MSQAGILVPSGTPSVATSYVTDSGTAIPVANILNVLANDTSSNNDNGIQTIGSGNTVTIQLTNRVTGTVTTTDATPTVCASLTLGAVAAVYLLEGDAVAFDVTDTAGGAYSFAGATRTDGATSTTFGSEFINQFEEAAMAASNVILADSGNTVQVQVVGIAGKTIHWSVQFTYRLVT